MKFDVLLFDPAWAFDNKVTGGSLKSGASQKYPTMPLPDVHRLAVPAIAHPNACLFLWVPTALKFSHGLTTLHAWGFDYKTTIYWEKERNSMGFWFANRVEELLVAFNRNASVEPFRSMLPNFIHCPPGEHSEKPEAFRKLIEDATGKISRRRCVEGFARRAAPGWTAMGHKVTGRDIRDDIRLLAGSEDVSTWPTIATA